MQPRTANAPDIASRPISPTPPNGARSTDAVFVERNSLPKVAASVVTYWPDWEQLIELLNSLDKYFDELIIIDNGGGTDALRGSHWTPDVRFEDNTGVSAALDAAIERADEAWCEWVVHFDQDSVLKDGWDRIRAELARTSRSTAIVSARYTERHTRRPGYSQRRLQRSVFTPIAAGSALRVVAWREMGGFDRCLPVDMFDFDFALSVQRRGWKVICAESVSIEHSVGRRRTHQVLGCTVTDPGHPPFRTYLKLDATLRVVRRHARKFPWWTVRHLVARAIELVVVTTLGVDRREHLAILARWCTRRPPDPVVRMYQRSRAST